MIIKDILFCLLLTFPFILAGDNADVEADIRALVKAARASQTRKASYDDGAASQVKGTFCGTCVVTGTESCEEESKKCICGPNFMGNLCSKPRNPCEEGYDERKPGNEMCGVTDRGFCSPELGSAIYHCECKAGFVDDPSTDDPDCVIDNGSPPEDGPGIAPGSGSNTPFHLSKYTKNRSKAAMLIFIPFLFLVLIIFTVAGIYEWRRYKQKQEAAADDDEEQGPDVESESLISRRSSNKSRSTLLKQSRRSLNQDF